MDKVWDYLAFVASVSVLFRSKDRAKNGASKRGGVGEEKENENNSLPKRAVVIYFCYICLVEAAWHVLGRRRNDIR